MGEADRGFFDVLLEAALDEDVPGVAVAPPPFAFPHMFSHSTVTSSARHILISMIFSWQVHAHFLASNIFSHSSECVSHNGLSLMCPSMHA
jgi:hypothetical protein